MKIDDEPEPLEKPKEIKRQKAIIKGAEPQGSFVINPQPGSYFDTGLNCAQCFPANSTCNPLSIVVKYFYQTGYINFSSITMAPFAVFGLVLSLFLGFRNNAAYDPLVESSPSLGHSSNYA